MARQRKIKRYSKRTFNSGRRSGVQSFLVGASLLLFAGLMIFIGTAIYPPVYDFLMGTSQRSPAELPDDLLAEPVSEAEGEAEPEPQPEQPARRAEGELRAAYLPGSVARSAQELESFLAALQGSEINAVLWDSKTDQGQLLYQSSQPQAVEWEAAGEGALDLADLASRLEEKGFYLITRMQTFSDPIGARGDRKVNAIHYQGNDEMLWLDNSQEQGGKPWMNPYADEVKAYLTALAVEQVELGAVMVVLDGVRFPSDSGNYATYGAASDGVSRLQALQSFVEQAGEAVEALGGRLAVFLPSTALSQSTSETRYGTVNPLELGDCILLEVIPSQYENGYSQQGLDLPAPMADPAATVRTILAYAQDRASGQTLIPLLQGGSEQGAALSAAQVATQLQAAQAAAGHTEYVLYAASGQYLLQ